MLKSEIVMFAENELEVLRWFENTVASKFLHKKRFFHTAKPVKVKLTVEEDDETETEDNSKR